jgi:hypothetical protein
MFTRLQGPEPKLRKSNPQVNAIVPDELKASADHFLVTEFSPRASTFARGAMQF